jgi:hypothetical protein
VEDVATGQPEITLKVERGPCLKAKTTIAVAQDDVVDRLGQNAVERPPRRGQQHLPLASQQPRGLLKTTLRQSLGCACGQLSAENAAVRE